MPAIERLTDKAIQSALKAVTAANKPRKLADGGGLLLDVRPGGSGWWRFRFTCDGKENMLSLGVYPTVSLKEARASARLQRERVAAGIDPSEVRRQEQETASKLKLAAERKSAGLPDKGSFEDVAREWWATVHQAACTPSHAKRTLERFEKDVFPWLGTKPIGQIEAPDLLKCLRAIEGRGAIETAHRAKDAAAQVFRFAIASGYAKSNPAADLKGALRPVEVKHHAALVEPDKVAQLLRDMETYEGHPVTRAALRLSAMSLLRPGELRHLQWAWVDFDARQIKVPGEVMKRKKAEKANGPAHVVPLSSQAAELLAELRCLTGDGLFIFPSVTSPKLRCMSENTVRSALRRLGYGNDDMTAHGFRAMARTMAAERLGIAAEVIEAQLAHAVGDALGRAYNRTQYLEQRKDLMQRWSDYLDALREGRWDQRSVAANEGAALAA